MSQKQSAITHSPQQHQHQNTALPPHHSSLGYPPARQQPQAQLPHQQPKDMRLDAHPSMLQYPGAPPNTAAASPYHRSATPNSRSSLGSSALNKDDSAVSIAPLYISVIRRRDLKEVRFFLRLCFQ